MKMVQELSSQHQRKIEEVYKKHSQELDETRRDNDLRLQDRVALVEREFERQRSSLQKNSDSERSELEARLNREIERVRKAGDDALRMAADERLKVEGEVANLREEVQTLGAKIEALLRDVMEGEKGGKEKDAELSKKDAELSKLKAQSAAEMQALKERSQLDLQNANETREKEVKSLQASHEESKNELRSLFADEKTSLQHAISLLEQNVRELQLAYDNRPSRPEDVQRMGALEGQVREKEEAFIGLRDEMQFYKLELVNREQNYNKVFGVSGPNIGVLNPVVQNRAKMGPQGTRNAGGMNTNNMGGMGVGGMGVGGMGVGGGSVSHNNSTGLPPLAPGEASRKNSVDLTGKQRKKGRPMSGTERGISDMLG